MSPLIPIAIDQVIRVIPKLVEIWKSSNPDVTLEEWLSVLSDAQTPYRVLRAQHFAAAGLAPLPPEVPRKPDAEEVLIAMSTGVIPEWFPDEVAEVVRKNIIKE